MVLGDNGLRGGLWTGSSRLLRFRRKSQVSWRSVCQLVFRMAGMAASLRLWRAVDGTVMRISRLLAWWECHHVI